jgi:hypothetical protein
MFAFYEAGPQVRERGWGERFALVELEHLLGLSLHPGGRLRDIRTDRHEMNPSVIPSVSKYGISFDERKQAIR